MVSISVPFSNFEKIYLIQVQIDIVEGGAKVTLKKTKLFYFYKFWLSLT